MESKKFIRKPSPYSVSPVRTNWLRRPFIGCICGRFKKVRRTRPNCSPRTMVSTHTILLSDQNVCVYILAFDDLNAHNGLKILKHTHNGLRKISTRTKTLPINVARHTKNVVTKSIQFTRHNEGTSSSRRKAQGMQLDPSVAFYSDKKHHKKVLIYGDKY